MCDCDEAGYCGYHEVRVPCSICGHKNDGRRPGPLCGPCRGTAKNAGGPYDRQRHTKAWRFDRYGMEG